MLQQDAFFSLSLSHPCVADGSRRSIGFIAVEICFLLSLLSLCCRWISSQACLWTKTMELRFGDFSFFSLSSLSETRVLKSFRCVSNVLMECPDVSEMKKKNKRNKRGHVRRCVEHVSIVYRCPTSVGLWYAALGSLSVLHRSLHLYILKLSKLLDLWNHLTHRKIVIGWGQIRHQNMQIHILYKLRKRSSTSGRGLGDWVGIGLWEGVVGEDKNKTGKRLL